MKTMTGDKNAKIPKKSGAANSRDARLAAALRENLRRRKAQERARGAQDDAESLPAAGESRPGDGNP